jgi:hypothetical protein
VLHHSAQHLKLIIDTARRDGFAHRRADLLATFLLIFANELQVDSPKRDARTDELFDLFENSLFARNRPLPVRRGLPCEVHLRRLPEGQTPLIYRSRAPFLNSFTFLFLEILFEGQGLGRIVGMRRLLMPPPELITPAETDVWRAWIPAKSAGKFKPFPVFHGECLCQTEQAFGQTREALSIRPLSVTPRPRGCDGTESLFPGSSLRGTGIPQNSPTKSYDKMLRQRLFREDEEA